MEEKNNNSPLPEVVWRFFIFLFFLVGFLYLLGVVYFDHSSPLDFINAFMANLVVAGKTLGCLAVSSTLYLVWNHSAEQRRKLKKMDVQIEAGRKKNEKTAVEIKEIEQIGSLYVEALQRGLNVEVQGRKISSPWSNIHTIHQDKVVDADPMKQIAAPARRLTVDGIVGHIDRNSYSVFIGSSLTKNLTAVNISILKRHMKIIGATQKGKSSFSVAFIRIVTQSHDPEFVQFALLDYQYQTTRVFNDLPHIVQVVRDNESIPLHSKNIDDTIEYLTYCYQIMVARSKMSRTAVSKLPLIIVFIEESLRLKKELKSACKTAQDKDEAERKYEQFSFAISAIAGLGLREKVQLLLVAQMDYVDKDPELQEAMVNITSGISFCVKRSAALAAGFYNTELLNKNAQDNQPGTAVVEMPDCNDLILAPEMDLEQVQKDREAEEMEGEDEEEVYTGPHLVTSKLLPDRSLEPSQDDSELQKVVGAWNEGHQSIMKVAGATGLGQNRSRVLIARAVGQGLIEGK